MSKSFAKQDAEKRESISINQYNKKPDDAMERINKGNFTTFEDVQKEIQSW